MRTIIVTVTSVSLVTLLLSFDVSAYLSSDGDEYTISYNKHGAVLTSVNEKHFMENNASGRVSSKKLNLYLGKDCDAFSDVYGRGSWEWANGGFVIHFQNKSFRFPRQEVDIPNMDKCRM